MLVNRLLVTIVLIPIGMAIIVYGELPFLLTIALLSWLGRLGVREFTSHSRSANHPSSLLPVAAALFVLMRAITASTAPPGCLACCYWSA